MSRIARLLTVVCAWASIAGPVKAAPAGPAPRRQLVELLGGGEVQVGHHRFHSMVDFHQSQLFRRADYRCATHTPAVYEFAPGDCTAGSTVISTDYDPGPKLVIQVVFHVISATNGRGELSNDAIRSQVEILNEDFQAIVGTPGAPGVDAAIEFVLATEDPDGNPTTGITRHTNDRWFRDAGDYQRALGWDPTRYLNIYTNTASGALGYATLPQTSAGDYDDGVVLLWSSVGRNAPDGGIYDQGRTATHEVGHYLGLYHTFQGGCTGGASYTAGDLIADTQAEDQPQFDCIERASACGGANNPIHNYMDYTPDVCMYGFTPEQINRMRCSVQHYRPRLSRGHARTNGTQMPAGTTAADATSPDGPVEGVDAIDLGHGDGQELSSDGAVGMGGCRVGPRRRGAGGAWLFGLILLIVARTRQNGPAMPTWTTTSSSKSLKS
jgi:hypothetical protein